MVCKSIFMIPVQVSVREDVIYLSHLFVYVGRFKKVFRFFVVYFTVWTTTLEQISCSQEGF